MATLAQFEALIATIGTGEKNTAEEVRTILTAFSTAVYLTGDIKEVDCTTAYVLENFDNTGLGINERVGWAICNGLNGTKDRVGRSSIGYGDTFPAVGFTSGSKDTVLVSHDHAAVAAVNPSSEFSTTNKYLAAYRTSGGDTEYGLQGTSTAPTTGITTTEGESGENKNYHPYIVTLMIQKL